MTQKQKEILRSWSLNLLSTYRIDFFRGNAIQRIVEYAQYRSLGNCGAVWLACREAKTIGFEPDRKYYTELLRELREIVKEVPLSDTEQIAIGYIFGGEWEEAEEALDKLRSERNEQN